jgi:hypothetical protein
MEPSMISRLTAHAAAFAVAATAVVAFALWLVTSS